MRYTIKHAPLVAALVAEMGEALQAMERGEYDNAFALLEARLRLPELASDKLPEWMTDLAAARVYRQLVKESPVQIAPKDTMAASVTATTVARVLRGDSPKPEDVAVASAMLSDFGWAFEVSED